MRKHFLWIPCLGAIMLILFSCKKEAIEAHTPQNPANNQLIPKIKSWLDEQKNGLSTASLANIESLELNLSYGEIRLEKYKESKEFIVIPILSGFKSKNNSDKNPANYLILVFENQDSITRGNIIQYISSTNQKTAPINTFYKIFTYNDLDCSGQFTILSIDDYFKYELKFENGKLRSMAWLNKKNAPKNSSGRMAECIDWYLQLWYVWSDGSMTFISETYVYTTCGEDCAQPRVANGRNYGTNCSGGGNGAAGGGTEYCNAAEWSTGVTGATDLESSIIESEASETRTKTYVWVFAKGTFNPSLKWKSHETGIHIKENGVWKWQSLTHNSVSKVGMVTGGSLQCDVNSATPTVGVYNAIMAIDYTFTWSFVCGGSPMSNSSNHTSAKLFNVND
jgi:hypothetical protein